MKSLRCQINTCQKIVHTVKTCNLHFFDTRIQFPIYSITYGITEGFTEDQDKEKDKDSQDY